MNNLSLILLTKNESEKLKGWGSWIKKILPLNEIIVIDDNSTDETIKIVKSWKDKNLSVKTYIHSLNNNFSDQRQFALSKTKNDWIIFLDADETLPPSTINYLNHLHLKDNHSYIFHRNLIYLNHTLKYGQCLEDKPIRLFNKFEGKFSGRVHEVWESQSRQIDTHQYINHYSFDSLNIFLKKINLYSTIRAQELFEKHHHSNLFQIISYPFFKFIHLYFIKLGFLDGIPGIIISLSMSFGSFLTRSKLWHLQQK